MPEVYDYPKWLDAYTPAQKERVYTLMRAWGFYADTAHDHHVRLRAPYGTTPVGGADMDPFFRYIAISEFLSEIRRGKSIRDCASLAKESVRTAVKKWNKRGCKSRMAMVGSYELQRWEDTEADTIETMQREFHELQEDIELHG